ncbi:hypothetical protein SLA2020_195340 [Shorea laevis]
MWRLFLKYGRVYSIYNPNKRNREGKRFGFVRYLDVKDEKTLEKRLDQIWVENQKMKVNIPRFKQEFSERKRVVASKEKEYYSIRDQPMQSSRSYAEVLTGKGTHQPEKGNGITGPQKGWVAKKEQTRTEKEYNPRREDWEWLEGCSVGTLRSLQLAPVIQERLYMEGMFAIKTKTMGGKLILLEGDDKEELKEIVENAKQWLNQWFDDIKPWSPNMVATERFVWLKCLGVPLQVWGSEFFASIASTWGTFISLDDNTRLKKRFDVAKVLISTSEQKTITENLIYKINGHMYSIKCSEEEVNPGCPYLKLDCVPKSIHSFDDDEDESLGSEWEKESILGSKSYSSKHEEERPTEPSEEEDDHVDYNGRRDDGKNKAPFKLYGYTSEKSTKCPIYGEWSLEDKRNEKSVQEEFNEVVGDCVKQLESGNHSEGSEQPPKIHSHSNIGKSDQLEGKNKQNRINPEVNGSKKEAQAANGLEKMDQAQETSNSKSQKENNMGLIEAQTELEASRMENRGGDENYSCHASPEISEKISTNRKNSQRKELTQQTQSKNTEANSTKEKAEEDDGVDSFWKSNSRRRKIRSCKSVYQISSMAGIKSRSSKKGGRASTKKNRKEKLPNFIPNPSNPVAGGSISDRCILNCNRGGNQRTRSSIEEEMWKGDTEKEGEVSGAKKVMESEEEPLSFWEGLASEDELNQMKLLEDQRRRSTKRKKSKKHIKEKQVKSLSLRCRRLEPNRRAEIEVMSEFLPGDNSISQGGFENCNKKFLERSWEEEAKELWRVGKLLGLVRRGSEEEIIKRLGEMEKRDRLALVSKKTEGKGEQGEFIVSK